MKKLIALLSVLALTLLVSCGKNEATTTEETTATEVVEMDVNTEATTEETATDATTEAAAEVNEEIATEGTTTEVTTDAAKVEMN